MTRKGLMILCCLLVVAWLSGCAMMETPKEKPYKVTPQGMVIWEDEFPARVVADQITFPS